MVVDVGGGKCGRLGTKVGESRICGKTVVDVVNVVSVMNAVIVVIVVIILIFCRFVMFLSSSCFLRHIQKGSEHLVDRDRKAFHNPNSPKH